MNIDTQLNLFRETVNWIYLEITITAHGRERHEVGTTPPK